ncbi:MAG: HD domain-containing protein [Patescibacteria group bacterium]|nr:HD domain-containing protein [Patescibacteria group bacterium]
MFPGQDENREKFFIRLTFLKEGNLSDVEQAYIVAKAELRHNPRKGELDSEGNPIRSFEHSRRTTLVLVDEIGCFEALMIRCALLHDVPEDSRYVTVAKIRRWCRSVELARIVGMVTKDPKEGYEDRLRQCGEAGDWRPGLIKLCDRIDNMRHLDYLGREFQRKQGDETRDVYLPIFTELLKIMPDEYRRGTRKVFEELCELVAKYETKSWELKTHSIG